MDDGCPTWSLNPEAECEFVHQGWYATQFLGTFALAVLVLVLLVVGVRYAIRRRRERADPPSYKYTGNWPPAPPVPVRGVASNHDSGTAIDRRTADYAAGRGRCRATVIVARTSRGPRALIECDRGWVRWCVPEDACDALAEHARTPRHLKWPEGAWSLR